MKKFCETVKKYAVKKPVIISLAVAVAVFFASLMVVLFTPVSFAGDYTMVEKYGNQKQVISIDFENCSKLEIETETYVDGKEVSETTTQYWYYREGGKVIILDTTKDMSKKEFKAEVKELKAKTDKEFETYYKAAAEGFGMAFEVDFAEIDIMGETAKNNELIAILVINCVLLVLSIALAGVSTYFVFTYKPETAEAAEVAEAPAAEEVVEVAEAPVKKTTRKKAPKADKE